MGFTDFVGRYQLARSEGLVLRYLTDAYRTLRQTVPESHRAPEVEDVIEWLGETVRQTDSSLLDEWEALSDPDHASSAVAHHEPPPPPRPLSQAGAPLPRDGAQRHVGARRRRLARRPRHPGPPRAGRRRPHGPAAAGGRRTLGVGRGAGGLLRRARPRPDRRRRPRAGPAGGGGGADRASRSAPRRAPRPGCATYARRSTTPRTTTTGSSRRWWTATPPTAPVSWCWRPWRCGGCEAGCEAGCGAGAARRVESRAVQGRTGPRRLVMLATGAGTVDVSTKSEASGVVQSRSRPMHDGCTTGATRSRHERWDSPVTTRAAVPRRCRPSCDHRTRTRPPSPARPRETSRQ